MTADPSAGAGDAPTPGAGGVPPNPGGHLWWDPDRKLLCFATPQGTLTLGTYVTHEWVRGLPEIDRLGVSVCGHALSTAQVELLEQALREHRHALELSLTHEQEWLRVARGGPPNLSE